MSSRDPGNLDLAELQRIPASSGQNHAAVLPIRSVPKGGHPTAMELPDRSVQGKSLQVPVSRIDKVRRHHAFAEHSSSCGRCGLLFRKSPVPKPLRPEIGYLKGNVLTNCVAWLIQCASRASLSRPSGSTSTQPFMGLPVTSNSLTLSSSRVVS